MLRHLWVFCFVSKWIICLFFIFYLTWCCLYIFNLRFWFQLSSYFIFHLYGRQTYQGPPHIRSEVKSCCSILTASSSLWEKLQLLLFLFVVFCCACNDLVSWIDTPYTFFSLLLLINYDDNYTTHMYYIQLIYI